MKELFQKHIVRRNKPVNIQDADEPFFQREYEVEIPASHFVILKDAYLLRDAIFSFEEWKYYWPYTHFVIPGLRGKLSAFRLLFKKTTLVPTAIWIANQWSEGYFHWLTDALPRLIAVKDQTDCRLVILPEKYSAYEYVSESLHQLGCEVQYYATRYPCKVNELILPGFMAPTGNYNVTLVNKLRDSLSMIRQAAPTRKIYISRRKAKFRTIRNEEELEALLSKFGFETHCFEDYSFGQQIEIMSEAEILLGLHGAGLTNMLFMQKGTIVFELRNEKDDQNNCYFSLASALDIGYYYQFNKGDSKETLKVGITVDVEVLEKNLKKISK